MSACFELPPRWKKPCLLAALWIVSTLSVLSAVAAPVESAEAVKHGSPSATAAPDDPAAELAHRKFGSVEEKIRAYLAVMTLEEKLLQMNLRPPPDKTVPGLGFYSQVGIARLGLGGIRGSDGPRGPRPNGKLPAGRPEDGHNGPVSPTSLCLASNWDPATQEEAGRQWGLLCKE